jgi:hypothetical protein
MANKAYIHDRAGFSTTTAPDKAALSYPERLKRIRTNNPCKINRLKDSWQCANINITEIVVTYQYLTRMAHFEGETSNRLLETLEEWNEFLKKYAPFFKEVA